MILDKKKFLHPCIPPPPIPHHSSSSSSPLPSGLLHRLCKADSGYFLSLATDLMTRSSLWQAGVASTSLQEAYFFVFVVSPFICPSPSRRSLFLPHQCQFTHPYHHHHGSLLLPHHYCQQLLPQGVLHCHQGSSDGLNFTPGAVCCN